MKKIFSNILKVINAITQVILIIAALISLFTAYVIFAPDQFPKPFRLMYNTSGETVLALSPVVAEQPTPTPEANHDFVPGEGVMVNMSTKIINLVDPTGHKYIRLTVVAEFAPDDPAYLTMTEEEKTTYLTSFQEKLNARMPIMDDAVITLLSTKTYDQLYTAEGKEQLRAEIMDAISKRLPDLHLLSIYFTEFVVQ